MFRAISITAILLAVFCAAGCQRESTPRMSEPARPSLSPPPAQAMTATDDERDSTMPATPSDRFPAYLPLKRQPTEMMLVAHPTATAPIIDGRADEPVWKAAAAITTLDYSSQRPITIRSVVTSDRVFFLVTYPKDRPAITHKTWVWDFKEQVYREGHDREDLFLFKWSMSGNDVRLELRDPEPHRADIWFWKAHRSNPSGYADDKMQTVSTQPGKDARQMRTTGPTLFFRRMADEGTAPWDEKFYFEYQGPRLEKYVPREATGSRGDIRAKGVWANGQWTIEFARKLNTGHDDDVAFSPGGRYLFGVSCYAIAYDTPHKEWSQPLYRTGDVFDRLILTIPGSVGR